MKQFQKLDNVMEADSHSKKQSESKKRFFKNGFKNNAIQKLLYFFFGIIVFTGCVKEKEKIKEDIVVGTKWMSTFAHFYVADLDKSCFMYIHFIDETNLEYCFVDYYYNKLTKFYKYSYTRYSDNRVNFPDNCMNWYGFSYSHYHKDALFDENQMTLRGSYYGGGGICFCEIKFKKAEKDIK